MAYNEILAERVADLLRKREVHFIEKKMFGGLAFMVNEKMCCGIVGHELMVRTPDEKYELTLQKDHVRKMDFTGRPMKGFVFVEEEGFKREKQLDEWLQLALEFGALAKPKPKPKKKKT